MVATAQQCYNDLGFFYLSTLSYSMDQHHDSTHDHW